MTGFDASTDDHPGGRIDVDAIDDGAPAPLPAGWPWLDDVGLGHLGEGSFATVTFLRGVERVAILEAFGASGMAGVLGAPSDESLTPSVALLPCADGWLVLEHRGQQGSRPEVLSRLTARGSGASATWRDGRPTRWTLAKDGQPNNAIMDDVRAVLEATRAAGPEDVRPLAVGLAARAAGLPLVDLPPAEEILFHPVVRSIEDELPAPIDLTEGPGLIERIVDAPPSSQRALAEHLARAAVDDAGVADDERVRAVLDDFGSGTRATFAPAESLLDELHAERAAHSSDDGRDRPLAAVQALRHACDPDPESAALCALVCYRSVRGIDNAAVDAEVVELLDRFAAEADVVDLTAAPEPAELQAKGERVVWNLRLVDNPTRDH